MLAVSARMDSSLLLCVLKQCLGHLHDPDERHSFPVSILQNDMTSFIFSDRRFEDFGHMTTFRVAYYSFIRAQEAYTINVQI